MECSFPKVFVGLAVRVQRKISKRVFRQTFLLGGLGCALLTGIGATIAEGAGPEWSVWVNNAKERLSAERLPKMASARAELIAALDSLESYLGKAKDDRGEKWKRFLRLVEIQEELAQDEPDADRLRNLERNMRQNHLGLDFAPFVRVREALEVQIRSLRYGQSPSDSISVIERRLDQLAELLESPVEGSDLARQRDIGLILSILNQSNQTPELIQQVQNSFSIPNVQVLVGSDFLKNKLARPVAQPNPVDEVILGTRILGTSYLSGQVTPVLIQNPNQATLRLQLSAQFSSNNVGTNRGVRLFTRGYANVLASESLRFTDSGFQLAHEASVFAPLQSQINAIEHRLKLVRKIAAKQAAKQKPLADAIARERLERRLSREFRQQIQEQIQKNRGDFEERLTQIVQRIGISKPSRSSWSSTDFLGIVWNQAGDAQVSAMRACPIPVDQNGLNLQIHQSSIINLVDPIIGGRIIKNQDLASFAKQFDVEPTERLMEEVKGEPWAITMAEYHPVEVEFDEQLMKFRIRTTKLDRGDQAIEQSASIEATYRPILENGELQFERLGEVTVEFTGRQQRGIRAVTLRSFLKSKFDSVFQQELFEKPLNLADQMPSDVPSILIGSIDLTEGWMHLTFR